MALLKKSLKIFALSLLLLFILLIGALAYVWMRPEVVINEKNVRWALQYAPDNLKISWDELGFKFESPDWSHKRIQVAAKNLCVSYAPLLHTCAPAISVDVAMAVTNWRPHLEQLREVTMDVSELTLNLPAKEETPEEPKSVLPDLKLPAFAELMPQQLDFNLIGSLRLSLKNIRVNFAEGAPLLAQAELTRLPGDQATELHFNLSAQAEQAGTFAAKAQANILLDLQKLVVNGTAQVTLPSLSIESPLSANWGRDLRAQAKPLIRYGKIKLNPAVDLHWSNKELNVTLGDIQLKNVWRKISLRLQDCAVKATLDSEKGYPAKAGLQCGLIVTPDKNRAGIKNVETLLSATLAAHTLGKGAAERLRIGGQAELSGANTFLQAQAKLDGEVEIKLQKPLKITAAKAGVEVHLRIPDFVIWKDLFESTPFAVPAPLHVLTGDVDLDVHAQLTDLESPLTADATAQTRLSSKNQRLFVKATADLETLGKVLRPQGLKVHSDVVLQDVHLQAPPLRLAVPPQVLPDKRFVMRKDLDIIEEENPYPTTKLPFELQWSVRVKTEKPVLISSNLLQSPVPIALDIQAQSDRKPQGKVMVQSFPFEFFRKKATVNNVDLIFHPDTVAPELSGKISYSNPEVNIRILLLGNTQRPIVNLESDPQLNQQQILSVLLFDKSLDELNEDEVNSTSNMSRAVSDGALGLFSLLFLSSTPIQSISYDPNSQSYTARMRLDDNTTFSMQSNMTEQRQFTLRRRLGGNWSVRTELSQEDDRADVVQTLLEWMRRF
ncbi:translocation/assembly module TamB domain-containing protein [Bdellovibrio bacteriovorus]|uniref:translocation/assembly module TamB domain-containing protein n=1 Tax=Bdellovibrio bacteriovorus TaxID=959 RepID=UPI003AA9329B